MTWNSLALLAMAPRAGGNAGLVLIVQFAAIIAIFWFLIIRPQRTQLKKHKELLAAIKKGDEVMTEGGIIGQVIHIADDRLTIRTAESTRLVVARAKIARVSTPGTTVTTNEA